MNNPRRHNIHDKFIRAALQNHRKQQSKKLLPAVYTIVFYHGKETPYPYSLSLQDCFDDPLSIMSEVLYQPLPLIDANQLSDEALKKPWIGPLLTAMKYIRQKDMTNKRLKAPVPVDPYLLPRTFFYGFKNFHLTAVSRTTISLKVSFYSSAQISEHFINHEVVKTFI